MIKLIDSFISRYHKRQNRETLKYLKEKNLISIGDHTYGINNLKIDVYKGSESKVIIGKFCSIGPSVNLITGGNHPSNWVSTFPFRVKFGLDGKYKDGMPYSNGTINIGNDVWIGSNVTILSGVKIGNGAIIAANSVIVKDVPAYSIVGGNPGKIIKFRFDENTIQNLQKLEWWNWSHEKILANVEYLNGELSQKVFEI